MQWLSRITIPQVGMVLQAIGLAVFGLSAVIAWSNWQAEVSKRQTDATLRYFDPLMDRDYIRYLWEIEEFTLCFERAAKRHLSYARHVEIVGNPQSFEIATAWWDLIENEHKELEACGRPLNIEEKLMVVYGRLEALASCARQKLCSFSRIEDMIESFDHMTVLAISNYLLLTRHHERMVAREWTMDGALVDLVELIEKHVFDGRAPATAYASVLDSRGKKTDSQPAITAETIRAIRTKRTRCDQSNDGGSAEWRRCATAER
jgi:hypothetical protein